MNNNNFENDEWHSSIGGYDATNLLEFLAKIDPNDGCCGSTPKTIEGFDGTPDDTIADQFTVTTGLIGKSGSGGTTTQSGEVESAQVATINSLGTTTQIGGGSSGGFTRHRSERRHHFGGGYPYGDYGYEYDEPYYNEPIVVDVILPPKSQIDPTLTMAFAAVLIVMLGVFIFDKKK